MPNDAALARAREIRDRIWHRMKQVLNDGDSLVGRNESLRVVLDDEVAAALRTYGDERARQRAKEDATLALSICPGPKRRCGCGASIAEAIRARGEKETARPPLTEADVEAALRAVPPEENPAYGWDGGRPDYPAMARAVLALRGGGK